MRSTGIPVLALALMLTACKTSPSPGSGHVQSTRIGETLAAADDAIVTMPTVQNVYLQAFEESYRRTREGWPAAFGGQVGQVLDLTDLAVRGWSDGALAARLEELVRHNDP